MGSSNTIVSADYIDSEQSKNIINNLLIGEDVVA
jgi:hypothetical protein